MDKTMLEMKERVFSLIRKADQTESSDDALGFAMAARRAAQALEYMRYIDHEPASLLAPAATCDLNRRPCWYEVKLKWLQGWLLLVTESGNLLVEMKDGRLRWTNSDSVRFQPPEGDG